jgi:hypothetical protein
MKIQVHIERLVLDGLPINRRSAPLIQMAVKTELARLFAEQSDRPVLLSSGATPSLRADDISVSSDSEATHIGYDLASSIHGGLHK